MVLPPDPWTRAMEDGSVRVDGLTWTCITEHVDAPSRFIATAEGSDVGENGVRRLALDVIAGQAPAGIPVFFGREHMQRNLIVRADTSLTSPRDLVGKRVASRLPVDSGTGAGVLMMLESGYGVDLHDIIWRTRNPDQPRGNKMGLRHELGPDNEPELFELLRRGEVDAVYVTTGPRYWSMFGGTGDKGEEVTRPYPDLRPLINDPTVIAETYRRTKLYPITDIAVINPELAARAPDAPAKVVDALAQANALAASYRDPAEQQLAEREIALLGEDPHQYGLSADARKNLDILLDLFYRLGSLERRLQPEELIVPSVARPR
jgi:hypothetical protein